MDAQPGSASQLSLWRTKGPSSQETVPGTGDLYHRESFRERAPGPLCYWFGKTLPVHLSDRLVVEWETILRPAVGKALYTHGITPRSIHPMRHRDIFWPSDRPDKAIVIDAPYRERKDNNWMLAISEMRQFFAANGWPSLIVEIVDCTEMSKRTWPIRPDEPIIEQWPHIRKLLLEQFLQNMALAPQSMVVLRRGTSENRDECPVTIVLTAPEVYGLLSIQDQIRKNLNEHGYGHIALEILRDRVYRTVDFSDPDLDDYQTNAAMGVSIGAKGESDSGTMGGYITLRKGKGKDQHDEQLGLTCYHVVRPGIPSHRQAGCDISGIPSGSELGRGLSLTQPSMSYHRTWSAEKDKKIIDRENTLKGRLNTLKEQQMKVDAGIKTDDQIKLHRSNFESSKSSLDKVRMVRQVGSGFFAQHSDFGHVSAASGYGRSPQDHLLDWALIALDEARRPGKMEIPSNCQYLTDCSILTPPSGPPAIGAFVWKKGRSTGITCGEFLGLRAEVVMDENDYPVQGTTEWAIVSEHGGYNALFSGRGDSGSFVVDGDGGMVGMIIGGYLTLGLSYVTPYADLVADIERVTGGKVLLGQ